MDPFNYFLSSNLSDRYLDFLCSSFFSLMEFSTRLEKLSYADQ